MRRSYLLIGIFLVFLFADSTVAQDSTKNNSKKEMVNIKELVAKQIQEIKAEEEKNNLLISNSNSAVIIPVVHNNVLNFSGFEIGKDLFSKFFLFVEGSLLVLIVFFFRKRFLNKKREMKSILKENIKKIREEKIGGLLDTRLQNVRQKLILQPIKIDGKSITAQAKRLSISKGEVHLAAKINLMMNNAR